MTEMPHPVIDPKHLPPTKLARLIAARDRYKAYTDRKYPGGAPLEQWVAWREWVLARRAMFAAEIATAKAEKRFNQRSKANERKRTSD
jgi:hypothetical protein